MVEAATLTGAVIVAFGHHAAALLGTDEPLLRAVEAASAATGERVWRMPLWDVYDEPLKEQGGRHQEHRRRRRRHDHRRRLPEAVRSYPWAHLDIAGTAWDVKDVSYLPSRATGYGARLFAELAAGWGGE